MTFFQPNIRFIALLIFALQVFSCEKQPQVLTLVADWKVIPTGTQGNLVDIQYVSADTGYILGYQEKHFLLKTTDGGQSWTRLPDNPASISVWHSFVATTDHTLYAARDTLYKSIDGGLTWTKRSSNLDGNHVRKFLFQNASTGYALTANGIYQTTNGGSQWSL